MASSRTHALTLVAAVAAAVIAAESLYSQAPSGGAATRLEVAPGSQAHYRVREQLARFNFPNDAVGTTETITGAIVVRADGTFDEAASKLTVDLRTIKTDEPKRDAFVRTNTLETNSYPMAEFVPRRHKGMPTPLPASGTAKFQLIGDMTLHGVTSETTWDVEAQFAKDSVTAKANTRFNFAKFKMTIPKVFGLLSVDDDIRLELDMRLRRTTR